MLQSVIPEDYEPEFPFRPPLLLTESHHVDVSPMPITPFGRPAVPPSTSPGTERLRADFFNASAPPGLVEALHVPEPAEANTLSARRAETLDPTMVSNEAFRLRTPEQTDLDLPDSTESTSHRGVSECSPEAMQETPHARNAFLENRQERLVIIFCESGTSADLLSPTSTSDTSSETDRDYPFKIEWLSTRRVPFSLARHRKSTRLSHSLCSILTIFLIDS